MDTKCRLQREKEELEAKLREVDRQINNLENLPNKLRLTFGKVLPKDRLNRSFPDHTSFLPICSNRNGNFVLYAVITKHDERTEEMARELVKRVTERYNDPYFD